VSNILLIDNMRKPRILYEDGLYHVSDKVNNDEFIFVDDSNKDLFLYYLEKACKKYDVILINYCIMGNHIHMMVKPSDGHILPEFMRWLKCGFSRAFNKVTGHSGVNWKGRYFSKPILDMSYFYNVFRYISENPVKAGICKTIKDYAYSALQMMESPPFYLQMPTFILRWLLRQWSNEGICPDESDNCMISSG